MIVLEIFAGEVISYDSKHCTARVELEMSLHEGDHIHIVGDSTDIKSIASSMMLDHQRIVIARSGDQVSINLESKVRPGDQLFRVVVASPPVAEDQRCEKVLVG